MKIIIDVDGGDEIKKIIKGIVIAIKRGYVQPKNLVLIGTQKTIEKMRGLAQEKKIPIAEAEIITCQDKIAMGEKIGRGIIRKETAIRVGLEYLKKNNNEKSEIVFLSAGATQAVVTLAVLILERIRQDISPAIGVVLPGTKRPTLLLDVGATTEPEENDLLNFALMGSTCMNKLFGLEEPAVGLINIGEEEGKGNRLLQAAHVLLKNCKALNFYGNIEPNNIFRSSCNVLVTPGVLGNCLIKFGEGILDMMKGKLGPIWHIINFIGQIIKRYGPSDHHKIGSALLFGVIGNVMIAHGNSSPDKFANAIKNAAEISGKNLPQYIKNKIEAN